MPGSSDDWGEERNLITELVKRLDDTFELDEEDQLRAEIAAEAVKRPNHLREAVKSISLPDQDYLLGDVYEALAEDDPERWGDFFVDEIDRLLELSRKSENKGAILATLDQFICVAVAAENKSLYQQIIDRLYAELDSPNELIRRKCVQTICDFVDIFNRRELVKLENMRESDPDWRIRYQTHETLVELNPKRYGAYRLSFADRIRIRFLDPDEPKNI